MPQALLQALLQAPGAGATPDDVGVLSRALHLPGSQDLCLSADESTRDPPVSATLGILSPGAFSDGNKFDVDRIVQAVVSTVHPFVNLGGEVLESIYATTCGLIFKRAAQRLLLVCGVLPDEVLQAGIVPAKLHEHHDLAWQSNFQPCTRSQPSQSLFAYYATTHDNDVGVCDCRSP